MPPTLSRAEILAALRRMGYRQPADLKVLCREYERARERPVPPSTEPAPAEGPPA